MHPDIIINWFIEYFDNCCSTSQLISEQKHQKSKGFLSSVPRGSEDTTEEKAKFREAVLWDMKREKPVITEATDIQTESSEQVNTESTNNVEEVNNAEVSTV